MDPKYQNKTFKLTRIKIITYYISTQYHSLTVEYPILLYCLVQNVSFLVVVPFFYRSNSQYPFICSFILFMLIDDIFVLYKLNSDIILEINILLHILIIFCANAVFTQNLLM